MKLEIALRFGNIEVLDRELLLQSILKKDRVFLLAHPEHILSEIQAKRFKKLVERRERDEPLAYILGEKEFFGLPFFVNRFTLIPRPETEILVEQVLEFLKKKKSKKKIAVVDVGTGSGCIIVSVTKNLLCQRKSSQDFSFLAVDTSLKALRVAKQNAEHHGVGSEIQFTQSKLLAAVKKKLVHFDEIVILANLPYLSETLYRNTKPTVQNFEPKTALLSGKDGLDHYRMLLRELQSLAPRQKISFWLEISPEQTSLVGPIIQASGAKLKKIIPDLTGRNRIVYGTF